MLALKTLAAAEQSGKTLIFDEVDAGIGGRVATVVGDKLRLLGERFQVLCITHLPQIAAAGGTHFHIEKSVKGSRTFTTVRHLTHEERVEEIARMIAGADAGERARATATELLARAATATKGTKGTKGTKARSHRTPGA
jgi:DNA repair protein RecN (Recombination protein N)